MADFDWQEISDEDASYIIERANPHLPPFPFSEETTKVKKASLPFYDKLCLFELTEFATIPPVSKYIIMDFEDEAKSYAITYTNTPVLKAAQENQIKITENNVADYVKFYLKFVHGQHGAFLPVEKIEDINFRSPTDQKLKKLVRENIKPFSIAKDDEGFKIALKIVFQDALFDAKADVNKKGEVLIHSPEMLVDEINFEEIILK